MIESAVPLPYVFFVTVHSVIINRQKRGRKIIVRNQTFQAE